MLSVLALLKERNKEITLSELGLKTKTISRHFKIDNQQLSFLLQ